MQAPIVVYDLDLKRVAYLKNALNPVIFERLNGEYTLEFSLPGDDPKWEYIVEENIIQDPGTGQYFAIKEAANSRDDAGIIGRVKCEHVFFSLLDEYIEDERVVDASATVALTAALNGTPFSPGVVNVGTYATAYFVRMNPVAAINRILERWGGEIRMRNYTVDLLIRRGTDRGVQFRYRKNLRQIRRTVDTRGLITRLYPYGWDGLTIESVNAGLKYIDSPNIGNWPRPKIREQQFDYNDPAELKAAAEEYLAKYDVPLMSYEIGVAELKELAAYGDLEEFELGDDIRIIDETLGIDIKARIIEYERRLLEPWNSRVTIANFRPGLADEMTKFRTTRQFVERIKSGDEGYVSANWLQGVIDTLKARLLASAAFADAEVRENIGLLFENTNPVSPAYGALYIGPGMFAIADAKIGLEWDWRTFGTGAGFTADALNAGRIRTDLINVESADGVLQIVGNLLRIISGGVTRVSLGEYEEGKYGLFVRGGEIYSTKFRTGEPGATTYIELNPQGEFLVVVNGKEILRTHVALSDGNLFFGRGDTGAVFGRILRYTDIYPGLSVESVGTGLSLRSAGDIDALCTGHVFTVHGNFDVTGAYKNCVVETSQGMVALSVRESPDIRFVDEGRGMLVDGECRLDLEPLFMEVIEPNTDVTPWQVQLTPLFPASLYVSEIGDTYFVVRDPVLGNGSFCWRLSGVRAGAAGIRFAPRDIESDLLTNNWEDDLL